MLNFIESGERIDFTASSDIESGEIVVFTNDIIGVSSTHLKKGEFGTARTYGVYGLDKNSNELIKQGVKVYLTPAKKISKLEPSNIHIGYCWEDVGESESTIKVRLKSV